MDTLEPTIGG